MKNTQEDEDLLPDPDIVPGVSYITKTLLKSVVEKVSRKSSKLVALKLLVDGASYLLHGETDIIETLKGNNVLSLGQTSKLLAIQHWALRIDALLNILLSKQDDRALLHFINALHKDGRNKKLVTMLQYIEDMVENIDYVKLEDDNMFESLKVTLFVKCHIPNMCFFLIPLITADIDDFNSVVFRDSAQLVQIDQNTVQVEMEMKHAWGLVNFMKAVDNGALEKRLQAWVDKTRDEKGEKELMEGYTFNVQLSLNDRHYIRGVYQTLQFGQKGNDVRALLIGITGSGKSSTGNTILSTHFQQRREYFPEVQASEKRTKYATTHTNMVFGREVIITDTPGAHDREDMQAKAEEIRSAIMSNPDGYDVVLYVLSTLTQDEFGMMKPEEVEVINILEGMLSDKIWQHTVFVFTYGNKYEDKANKIKMEKKEVNSRIKPIAADLSFKEFAWQNRFANDKFAIGPYIVRANYQLAKIDNHEEDPVKRRHMVYELLKEIDQTVVTNNGKRLQKDDIVKEYIHPTKEPDSDDKVPPIRNSICSSKQLNMFLFILIAVLVVVIAVIVKLHYLPLDEKEKPVFEEFEEEKKLNETFENIENKTSAV